MSIKTKCLPPIGSVVILKDGEQPLMIYGIMQSEGKTSYLKNYKHMIMFLFYIPQGNLESDMHFLFNQEDIEKVIFRGLEDEERIKFLDELASKYENKLGINK